MVFKNIKNSTVLIRADIDIKEDPMKNENRGRIRANLETITELLEGGNKLIICGHRGRPGGKADPSLSTEPVMEAMIDEMKKNKLEPKVSHLDQFSSFEQTKWKIDNSNADIIFLENTRFSPNEKSDDTKKRKVLAAQYATLADYYVDEAFTVSHRKEATNYHVKEFLPSMLGINHRKEKDALRKLRNNPESPYYFIMGGAKLETKIPLVKKVLLVADRVYLAGLISFTFLQAAKELGMDKYKDIDIHNSYVEDEYLAEARELLERYPEKLFLPLDFVTDEDEKLGKYCADVGPETIKMYQEDLQSAKTIFWNGPLGRYEKEPFDAKTIELANIIADLDDCYTVIGGGDSVNALPLDKLDNYSFVSMGGGASLATLGR